MANVHTTTDHLEIREWVEDHGGEPAIIDKGGMNGSGILYVDFHSGLRNNALKDVTWDEFFDAFEENHLAFIYRETKSNKDSSFFKFVARDMEEEIGKEGEKEREGGNTDDDAKDPNRRKPESPNASLDEDLETIEKEDEDLVDPNKRDDRITQGDDGI
jgi:hypothetical protein